MTQSGRFREPRVPRPAAGRLSSRCGRVISVMLVVLALTSAGRAAGQPAADQPLVGPTPTDTSPAPPAIPPGIALSARIREEFELTPENFDRKFYRVPSTAPELVMERIKLAFLAYIEGPRNLRYETSPPVPRLLMQGKIEKVEIEFEDGVYDGTRIERAYAKLERIQIDYRELIFNDKLRFREQGKVDFLFLIPEDQLNAIIQRTGAKSKKLRSPKLTLAKDLIQFSGELKSPVGFTSFRLSGRFVVKQKDEIHFEPERLKVGILPVPGLLSRTLFDRVNPIANLEELYIQVRPELIQSYPGRLYVLTGGLKPMMERLENERRNTGR